MHGAAVIERSRPGGLSAAILGDVTSFSIGRICRLLSRRGLHVSFQTHRQMAHGFLGYFSFRKFPHKDCLSTFYVRCYTTACRTNCPARCIAVRSNCTSSGRHGKLSPTLVQSFSTWWHTAARAYSSRSQWPAHAGPSFYRPSIVASPRWRGWQGESRPRRGFRSSHLLSSLSLLLIMLCEMHWVFPQAIQSGSRFHGCEALSAFDLGPPQ